MNRGISELPGSSEKYTVIQKFLERMYGVELEEYMRLASEYKPIYADRVGSIVINTKQSFLDGISKKLSILFPVDFLYQLNTALNKFIETPTVDSLFNELGTIVKSQNPGFNISFRNLGIAVFIELLALLTDPESPLIKRTPIKTVVNMIESDIANRQEQQPTPNFITRVIEDMNDALTKNGKTQLSPAQKVQIQEILEDNDSTRFAHISDIFISTMMGIPTTEPGEKMTTVPQDITDIVLYQKKLLEILQRYSVDPQIESYFYYLLNEVNLSQHPIKIDFRAIASVATGMESIIKDNMASQTGRSISVREVTLGRDNGQAQYKLGPNSFISGFQFTLGFGETDAYIKHLSKNTSTLLERKGKSLYVPGNAFLQLDDNDQIILELRSPNNLVNTKRFSVRIDKNNKTITLTPVQV